MDILLNWLWQGIVVALVTAAVLAVVPRSRTRTRYTLAWTACIAVVALPAVPVLLAEFVSPVSHRALATAPALSPAPVVIPPFWWTTTTAALSMWSLWALFSACRTAAAAFALRGAKRSVRSLPPDVEARLVHWRRLQTTGRRTRLALSDDVRTAGVLGGRVPIIAVAPALLECVDLPDIDRVVAHEWAHVQRRDDIAQIGVRAVRAVAGWHPAVWWLERQLHVEREVACDEMAVAATGCAKTYAACLTAVAAVPAGRAGVPALAAVSSSGLRERVVRIVAAGPAKPPRAPRLTFLAGVAVVAVAALLVGQVTIVGAVAPAAGRAVSAMDRVLAESPAPAAPPVTTVVEPTAPVRRAPAPRPAASASAQPGRQDDRDGAAPAVETALAPAPLPAAGGAAAAAFELPGSIAPAATPVSASGPVQSAEPPQAPAWNMAVDAGKAIGARSEQAAAATAGFFTRIGKQVAGSF